ncbi:MAG: PAS domain-containing protein [Nitrospirae bacterium]|nr:PAS domain-containing protein [Nitrospirota bacterium]
MINTVEDIKKLFESLEAVLGAIGNGISIQDISLRILYQNSIHKNLTGDHAGECCFSAYKKRDCACEDCPVVKAFSDGGIHSVKRSAPVNGEMRHFEIIASPLKDSEGNIIAGIEILHDITEFRETVEALEESQKKYRALVDTALVGIFKTNTGGDILYVNDALITMFEFNSAEELMREKVVIRYKDPSDRNVFIEGLRQNGRVQGFETRLITKTGKNKNVLVDAALDGDMISGVLMDITDRIELEHSLQERLKELQDFYDMAVGREMKMVDLKKEVARLKEELEKYR